MVSWASGPQNWWMGDANQLEPSNASTSLCSSTYPKDLQRVTAQFCLASIKGTPVSSYSNLETWREGVPGNHARGTKQMQHQPPALPAVIIWYSPEVPARLTVLVFSVLFCFKLVPYKAQTFVL